MRAENSVIYNRVLNYSRKRNEHALQHVGSSYSVDELRLQTTSTGYRTTEVATPRETAQPQIIRDCTARNITHVHVHVHM